MLQYQVPDMSCDHCVQAITKAVNQAVAQATVQVDLPNHRVTVLGTEAKAIVEGAIRNAGYSPVPA